MEIPKPDFSIPQTTSSSQAHQISLDVESPKKETPINPLQYAIIFMERTLVQTQGSQVSAQSANVNVRGMEIFTDRLASNQSIAKVSSYKGSDQGAASTSANDIAAAGAKSQLREFNRQQIMSVLGLINDANQLASTSFDSQMKGADQAIAQFNSIKQSTETMTDQGMGAKGG